MIFENLRVSKIETMIETIISRYTKERKQLKEWQHINLYINEIKNTHWKYPQNEIGERFCNFQNWIKMISGKMLS